jgi:hypothetical protein
MKPFRMQQLTALVSQILKDSAALCTPRRREPPPLPARA